MIKTSPSPFNPLNPLYLAFAAGKTIYSLGKRIFPTNTPMTLKVNTVTSELPRTVLPPEPKPFPLIKVPEEPLQSASSTIEPLGDSLVSVGTATSSVMPFVSIVAMLFKRKKRDLENIDVNITADKTSKFYRVSFGNDERELQLSFQVQAGKPLCFPHRDPDKTLVTSIPRLFPPRQGLLDKVLNRTERYVECTITVDDRDNPLLKNGPLIHPIVFNNGENIRIIHRDPKVKKKERIPTEIGDPSIWNTMSVTKLNASALPDSIHPKKFPLKEADEFVSVEKRPALSSSCKQIQPYRKKG